MKARLRRTVLYALAFTAIQTVIVGVTSFAQLPSIRQSHDTRLVRETVGATRSLPVDDDARIAPYFDEVLEKYEDLLYVEMRSGGRLLVASNPELAESLPPVGRERYGTVSVDDIEVEPGSGQRGGWYRAVVVPFRASDGETRVLRALARDRAESLAVERTLDRLWIVLPASFIAASIVSWLLLRRTLHPLRAVARKVEGLSAGALDETFLRAQGDDEDPAVAELKVALNEALERIEAGYQAQSEFVANVAHEIKTPIAVLQAQAQVLSGDKATYEDLREFRDSTVDELRRLGKLVESFLVVARAGRGGELTRRERVFLPEVVVNAAQHTRVLAREHGVTVKPTLPDPDECALLKLDGDPELLGSMVENIVRNAIRFSPRDSAIDLRLATAPSGDRAQIFVRDRGPGVPATLAARLFDRYVRLEGTSRSGRNFGLGLSIATGVARLHGGEISVENHPEGGAEFCMTLPIVGPPESL